MPRFQREYTTIPPLQWLGFLWGIGIWTTTVSAQLDFDLEPINYSQSTPQDAVVRLQSKLDSGDLTLTYDDQHGYLKSI